MISRRLGLSAFLLLAVLAVASGTAARAEEGPAAIEPPLFLGACDVAAASTLEPPAISDTPPPPTFMTCPEQGCTSVACNFDYQCASACASCEGSVPYCVYGCWPNINSKRCHCLY